jgi:HAD superfamily hydrolase (TIGR01509 family)
LTLNQEASSTQQMLSDCVKGKMSSAAHYADMQPIPGLRTLLQAIRAAGIRQIAVTNAPPDNVRLMLQEIGLSDAFETIVFGEDCTHAKPHPEPYLVGLRKLGLEDQPEKALIFEDSPSGVRAGVAAGVRTIALATTQPPGVLAGLGASDVIPDYQNVML